MVDANATNFILKIENPDRPGQIIDVAGLTLKEIINIKLQQEQIKMLRKLANG